MKVYQVITNVDRYQSLLVSDPNTARSTLLAFDGTSMLHNWPSKLSAVIENLTGPLPDFLDIGAGNLVLHDRSWMLLKGLVGEYSELLPVVWTGGEGHVMNIIKLSCCLNEQLTEWIVGKESGKKIRIAKHEFDESRIPPQLIFKIPENCFELYCTESFKNLVDNNKLSGLKFIEVWQSIS